MVKMIGPLPSIKLPEKSFPASEMDIPGAAAGGFAELMLNMKTVGDESEMSKMSTEAEIMKKIKEMLEVDELTPGLSRRDGGALWDMPQEVATEADLQQLLPVSEGAMSSDGPAKPEIIKEIMEMLEVDEMIPVLSRTDETTDRNIFSETVKTADLQQPLPVNDQTLVSALTAPFTGMPRGETSKAHTLVTNMAVSQDRAAKGGGEGAGRRGPESLFQSFLKVLQPVKATGEVTKKDVAVLKNLLEKFITAVEGRNSTVPLAEFTGSEKDKELFRELAAIVRERTSPPPTLRNQWVSPVRDAGRWAPEAVVLKRAESMVPMPEMKTEKSASPGFFMPMSKIEQMTVQNASLHTRKPEHQHFLKHIQEMITSSRMFHTEAGEQRMLIKLKPSSLGEMVLKFTQTGGETIVKMVVTTQAAKETLESNMHQLRSMFAPHQVVVEKAEPNFSQQFQQEREQQDGRGEREEEAHTPIFEEEAEEELKTEALTFSDILNEKV